MSLSPNRYRLRTLATPVALVLLDRSCDRASAATAAGFQARAANDNLCKVRLFFVVIAMLEQLVISLCVLLGHESGKSSLSLGERLSPHRW